MTRIDALYGNFANFEDFRKWVFIHYPTLLREMYDPFLCKLDADTMPWDEFPIANFSLRSDRLLLWRCPLHFVRGYLKVRRGWSTRWYHKLFFKH